MNKQTKNSISPDKKALLELLLQKSKKEVKQGITAISSKVSTIPLTHAQESFWILDELSDNPSELNVVKIFQIKGLLEIEILEQCLNEILRRHDCLRSRCIVTNGQPTLYTLAELVVPIPTMDLSHLPESEKERSIKQLIAAEEEWCFDLEQEVLIRVQLVLKNKIKDSSEYILLFNFHHFVIDGYGLGLFFQELNILYNYLSSKSKTGQAIIDPTIFPLSPLPIKYKDYAYWQRQKKQQDYQQQIVYWKKQLAGTTPNELSILTKSNTSSKQEFSRHKFVLDRATTKKIRQLNQKEGVTVFTILMAVFQLLIHRYAQEEDVIIATSVTNRLQKETEQLIGTFANNILIKNTISGERTFQEFLGIVQQNIRASFDHQELPFEVLIKELPANLDVSSLLQISFVFHSKLAQKNFSLKELVITEIPSSKSYSYADLNLSIKEYEEVMQAEFNYRTASVQSDAIERMAAHFLRLMESILLDPTKRIKEYDLLSLEEREQLLFGFNDTQTTFPRDKTIVDLFEEQVQKNPDNIALVFEDTKLTYQQVNEKANEIGHYLKEKYDIQADDIIMLQLERSEWTVIAILGVLKAGAAYLPISPTHPPKQIDLMLIESQAKVLLTDINTLAFTKKIEVEVAIEVIQQIKGEHLNNPKSDIQPNNLAYIIYTSGSTGKPNGVMVEHKSVVNLVSYVCSLYELSEIDNILQPGDYSSDFAVEGIFKPLCIGASVVLVPKLTLLELEDIQPYLEEKEISYIGGPPALLSTFKKTQFSHLKTFCTGGEAPNMEDVRFYATHYNYFNTYGPTECTVNITHFRVPKDSDWLSTNRLPIGKPMDNIQIYILNKGLQLVPIGIPGELCVSGVGLARGYLNNATLTAEKFIPHPFKSGERLYKTGDLASWLPDGNIEFLGRIDHQLKIRGHRVELGEIEQTLLKHSSIENAIVVAKTGQSNYKELIAYIILNQKETPDFLSLKSFLKEYLSSHMIPVAFVPLEAFPLTNSGKIDRKSLPDVERYRLDNTEQFISPSTPTEIKLVKVWKKVLWLEGEISIHDDFFDLGGHSLLAVQLIGQIEETFAIKIPLKELFKIGTVAQIAILIDTMASQEQGNTPAQAPILFTPLDPEIYRQLLIYVNGWQGERKTPQSLLFGHNMDGTRPALFWCFQGYQEFSQLSQYLGKEQPVYGMRSGHLAMEYTEENILNLAKHYANEIELVDAVGPYLLGGNCQSSFITYEVAKELKRRRKTIQHTFLLDSLVNPRTWEVQEQFLSDLSLNSFTFLYGKYSSFNPYRYYRTPVKHIQKYFSKGVELKELPCDHGEYFNEPNIQVMAEIIKYRISEIINGNTDFSTVDKEVGSTIVAWTDVANQTLKKVLNKVTKSTKNK